ncbi:hypothetical protein [Raoultibacter timonensis]|uniref:hypothetical protein n=1 Tax=Raoultibacter timonensis TaxID=1907662 RepID=UPI000C8443EB|nr:hypothetical protein [Raoultibacter timonensis]
MLKYFTHGMYSIQIRFDDGNIAAFGALALSSYGANVACLLKSHRLSAVPTCIGFALAVLAAIVVRVPFYSMHMTVGM